EIARLRLHQLLDLAETAPLVLTTPVDATDPPPVDAVLAELLPPVDALPGAPGADTTAARVPVRQATQDVRARSSLLTATRAQRRPAISIASRYDRVAYPSSGLPGLSEFRTNWTISATVELP